MMLAENPKVFPIEAGYEPVDFISLFPLWSEREDVKRYGNKVRLQHPCLSILSTVTPNISHNVSALYYELMTFSFAPG